MKGEESCKIILAFDRIFKLLSVRLERKNSQRRKYDNLGHAVIFTVHFYCSQVNTNGVISFLRQVSQYTPYAFPVGNNARLVAPFWADVDTRVAGEVFYRETFEPVLLQKATDDVKNTYVDHRNFKATWLLIVTWYEVAFYGSTVNKVGI